MSSLKCWFLNSKQDGKLYDTVVLVVGSSLYGHFPVHSVVTDGVEKNHRIDLDSNIYMHAQLILAWMKVPTFMLGDGFQQILFVANAMVDV